MLRAGTFLLFVSAVLFLGAPSYQAEVKRIVMIKVDGLPSGAIDRFVREQDPRTGKSVLPWFDQVFYKNGTRVANFYTRGFSLSGPSWSMLDTGQNLQIRGNVEFDRYTLQSYDYLNFIPFYLNFARSQRVDMLGVEVLEELGIPLLMDAYRYENRRPSFQLYQRGVRWRILQRALENRFLKSPGELLSDWIVGAPASYMLLDQLEREVITNLKNPDILYLDYYTAEFDKVAHNRNQATEHLRAIQSLDRTLGRIWTAIEQSPLSSETALILVSDHGVNSVEGIYSQGFNLVDALASASGGAHHVVTKRRLLLDYAVKGIYPFTPLVITRSKESSYLGGQSNRYPTALLDFDGNERAAIYLRNSDINILHILLQQLQRKGLDNATRKAAMAAFFSIIDRNRKEWSTDRDEINEELKAIRHRIQELQAEFERQPKDWSQEDLDTGRDQDARRIYANMARWSSVEQRYTEHQNVIEKLLALRPGSFDPSKYKQEDLIKSRSVGGYNSIYQLQNYVTGLGPTGFVLKADGSLDIEASFRRINYFEFLQGLQVRNRIQPALSGSPIDFLVTRIPRQYLIDALREDLVLEEDPIWFYKSEGRQALLLARRQDGKLFLRYLPISGLSQDSSGRITFNRAEWSNGFPLEFFEDPHFAPPDGARQSWLNDWHTDIEWIQALHRTTYSTGLVGLYEQLSRTTPERADPNETGLGEQERLVRRFTMRRRWMAEPDLLVLANNHWNFDVKGFNPGGNHGSLFRISTHSALMFAGGSKTGIQRGHVVDEPYDSLSFVPTVFSMTGELDHSGQPGTRLRQLGFRSFPGRVISGVLNSDHTAISDVPAGNR